MQGLDVKKLGGSVKLVWSYKMGQMVSLLVHLGDKLGLFRALAYDLEGRFVTAAELAQHTNLHLRWIVELLRGLTAANILEYEEGTGSTERFRLAPEMAEVLANEEGSMMFAGGAFAGGVEPALSEGLVRAFRTGVGMSYRERSLALGEENSKQTMRMLGTWTRGALVQQVISALGGGLLVGRLREGGSVLDMGCGAGIAVNCVAAAFPQCVVHGVDPDIVSLGVARKDAAAQGLANAHFFDALGEHFDQGIRYDFAMCLDIVHDCPFPDKILASILRLLKPGGTLLIKDIKSTGSFPSDLKKIDTLAMLYGFSVSMCLSSSLSEPGGMGLGTVGFNPPVAERLCGEAGFVGFRKHDFKDPANLYYEMRAPGGGGTGQLLDPVATSAARAAGHGGGLSDDSSGAHPGLMAPDFSCGDCAAQPPAERQCAAISTVDLSRSPGPSFCGCHAALSSWTTCPGGSLQYGRL